MISECSCSNSPSKHLPFSKSKMSEIFICKGLRMNENIWSNCRNLALMNLVAIRCITSVAPCRLSSLCNRLL